MSDPPYDVEKDPYPLMSDWRQSERHHMIKAMRQMIDEATRMAKSKRAPASERIRWTRLAGQLIWYKDAILRSMSLESMEREMVVLKKASLSILRLFLAVASVPSNRYVLDTAHRTVRQSSYEPVTMG